MTVAQWLAGVTALSPVPLPGTRDAWLPALLRACGCQRGAEVGVERGHYARILCETVPGLHLLAVDAWTAYPGYREHVSQAKLDAFYIETVDRLAPYTGTIHRGFSVEVAATVADGSLDFVYLDANHVYAHVLADLAAWAPKVRPGGVVAGHDYGRRSVGQVEDAVRDWTRDHHIAPWGVLMGDRSPSWFWVVPGA